MTATMPMVDLEVCGTRLTVAPTIGCSITRFETDGPDGPLAWLRPFDPLAVPDLPAAGSGCFPLVPYSGRIASGRLQWRGAEVVLPTGPLGDPHALHGTGWVRPWETVGADAASASFRLIHDGERWPWAFAATQDFRLHDRQLDMTISLRNTGVDDMPAGIGIHPVFVGPDLRLKADARTLWAIDERKLFAGIEPAVAPRDFRNGAPLAETDLEHGLTDWDGGFELFWADRDEHLRVTASETLRHLVIYTRAYSGSGGFACVEPVSHSVDAFNLSAKGVPGTGSAVLGPGETLRGAITFRVVAP